MTNLKTDIVNKIKSSPRFGDLFVNKNLQELLKERRFLFFTKNGPIEVVFNIKHYISGLFITLMVVFKILQFLVFGVFTMYSSLHVNKNTIKQAQQFTDKEVEALKDLAETVITKPDKNIELSTIDNDADNIKMNFDLLDSELTINENFEKEKFSLANELETKIKQFKDYLNLKKKDALGDESIFFTDESIFDDFASLASPEMIPIEQTLKSNSFSNLELINSSNEKKLDSLSRFSYNQLPVIPFAAPRNNTTKMIQFSKTINLEILELVNVFKTLKLKPDSIDLNEIENLRKESKNNSTDTKLIEDLSLSFHYLESLKHAIIYLPLKPPMQYYYVSSPFGMRVHPKTKKKQMHKGIDMAGTWQEEVRASANGTVVFSGRYGSFGKVIKIKHKHHVTTLYGHLHKLLVKKGDTVSEGQIIGKMGATGRVAGAHLHYEIKVKNKAVNPYDFISIGRNLVSSSIIK